MLYEQWRQIARSHRHECALRDLESGQAWTFSQLAEHPESVDSIGSAVSFPQGLSAAFVLQVLGAWRRGQIVCALEAGQRQPIFTDLPEGCVHLKITSATTGASRAIAFTAEQLAADAANIVATMGLRSDWPNLGVISLAHSYGFANLVLPLLLHGIPLIVGTSPLPEAVKAAAKLSAAFVLPAVPALWRTWHDANAIPSGVRLAISAGAPLPLSLEEAVFGVTGIKIHNFVGASECGGIAYDSTPTPRADASCAGAPMQNVHLSLNGDSCLRVNSRAVGKTYWPEPEANLGNGCFQTSDLAELKDGLVFLRGRAGDQINIAGRKIMPEAIERILLTHSAVGDCLIFGAPSNDAGRSEMIVACVVAKSAVSGEELKQFLLEHLPAWQVPRDWWFVESLKANQRGKLSRVEWRQRYHKDKG